MIGCQRLTLRYWLWVITLWDKVRTGNKSLQLPKFTFCLRHDSLLKIYNLFKGVIWLFVYTLIDSFGFIFFSLTKYLFRVFISSRIILPSTIWLDTWTDTIIKQITFRKLAIRNYSRKFLHSTMQFRNGRLCDNDKLCAISWIATLIN